MAVAAAARRRAGCRGESPREPFSERFLFVLSKRNPSDSKEKTALVRVGGGDCLLRVSACREAAHPVVGWLCLSPAVHCFASLAALPRRSPGGKGAEPPNNLPPSTPLQTPQTTPRGRAPPAPPISLARAPSAGGVSKSHFAPQNGTHYKTPCGQWQKLTKHRNGRPHRAAKIAPGLCLGAIPYLAPLRRNRAAVRRAKYMGLRGFCPGGPYIFYGGEPTRGTPGPPRIILW